MDASKRVTEVYIKICKFIEASTAHLDELEIDMLQNCMVRGIARAQTKQDNRRHTKRIRK